jgi:hypothetical protein
MIHNPKYFPATFTVRFILPPLRLAALLILLIRSMQDFEVPIN